MIVVASNDKGVIDFCRESNHLIGFYDVERAISALMAQKEIKILIEKSKELSSKLKKESSLLKESIRKSIFELRQLNSYNGNEYHKNIRADFQPYIYIQKVLDIDLLPLNADGLLVNAVNQNDRAIAISGTCECRVIGTGRVSALNPNSEGPIQSELDLFDLKEIKFSIKYSGYYSSVDDKEYWNVVVIDENLPLFELPRPPMHWIPKPHA